MSTPAPYRVLEVAHALRVTPERAHDTCELADLVERAEPSSLLLHTQYPLLRTPDAPARPPDDFSVWVAEVLREPAAAERVALACAEHATAAEPMREALTAALRSARSSTQASAPDAFRLHAADPVTLSEHEVTDVDGMCDALASASASTWYWHAIEEPFRAGGGSSLARWLAAAGEARVAERLTAAARTAPSLESLRRRVIGPWRRSCLARRLASADPRPVARATAEREVLRRLAHRIVHPEPSE